jgi:hypothetical protein
MENAATAGLLQLTQLVLGFVREHITQFQIFRSRRSRQMAAPLGQQDQPKAHANGLHGGIAPQTPTTDKHDQTKERVLVDHGRNIKELDKLHVPIDRRYEAVVLLLVE